jgi:hypothetical protein
MAKLGKKINQTLNYHYHLVWNDFDVLLHMEYVVCDIY